jgi:hypothetical protein
VKDAMVEREILDLRWLVVHGCLVIQINKM